MKKLIIVLILISMGLLTADAHQPRIVYKQDLTDYYRIYNPEVSQAFYGELKGGREHYIITEDSEFDLYIQILVPDIPGARRDFVVEIIARDLNETLNGSSFIWKNFYEEFAGDYYLQGPEIKQRVGPGTYFIEVYNNDNQGKYILVVGQEEKFPINEMLHAILVMPELKHYFGKPIFLSYFNRIGLYTLGFLVLLAIIILGAFWAVRKIIGR